MGLHPLFLLLVLALFNLSSNAQQTPRQPRSSWPGRPGSRPSRPRPQNGRGGRPVSRPSRPQNGRPGSPSSASLRPQKGSGSNTRDRKRLRCPPEQINALEAKKEAHCSVTKCHFWDSCEVLRWKKRQWQLCTSLRAKINNCFVPGDEEWKTHRDEVIKARAKFDECVRLEAKCRGQKKKPQPQPQPGMSTSDKLWLVVDVVTIGAGLACIVLTDGVCGVVAAGSIAARGARVVAAFRSIREARAAGWILQGAGSL